MPEILSVPPAPLEELRREVDRLRLLHSIGLEFAASLDFEELLPRVVERVRAALDAEGGALWIAEPDGGLRCRIAVGSAARKLVGTLRTTGPEDAPPDALTVPMVAGGGTVGLIQLSPRLDGRAFDRHDQELLEGLATLAAFALRNAQLHGVERRADDLALVVEISREIGSTLDLDRVLRSVVNLASKALVFDRGAVGLYEKGRCEIRAVAGQENADPKDPGLQDLIARSEWAAGRGEPLYLSDRAAPSSDAERVFTTIFGQDLETDGVASGLYLPLKDEEGILGVLVFESGTADFAGDSQRELALILANQTAVALRNAQLYHQVPMVDALGALAARRQTLLQLPRRKVQLWGALLLLTIAALTLIRWPLRVVGADPVFRATALSPVRAFVPGVLDRLLVTEGSAVARGAPLATIRASRLAADREATAADAATAEREASMAAARSDPAEERLQRIRSAGLQRELSLFDQELALATVRAPTAGVVLTPHVESRIGTALDEGDLLLTLGRTDTLELEFWVDQRDVTRVRPGQEVRVRTDALPQRTFTGRVSSVGQLPADSAGSVRYPVRAAVANPSGNLKPEMAAFARVLTEPESAMSRLLRGPSRWARLLWWRTWS